MLKPTGKPTTVFTHMMTDIQRIIVGESPLSPQALQEAAPWRRPSRAKDTTDQGALDFSKRPEPEPAPEPAPKKKRAVDPSEVYTVLPRSEHRQFERLLEQYIIDDNWNSDTINGQNVESRIVGVLQNEIDGKVYYTVIYLMVHAEALGKSTFKKRFTTSQIDKVFVLTTAYFADSRGKPMSLLRRQRNDVVYGKVSYDKSKGAPKLPNTRPSFSLYDYYMIDDPKPFNPPFSPSADTAAKKARSRLDAVRYDNAKLAHSRALDSYTGYRRYYRLDDLPSPERVKNMGIDLWNEVARKIGVPEFEEKPIPAELLPTPDEWPPGYDLRDFNDYYDDEIEEAFDPRNKERDSASSTARRSTLRNAAALRRHILAHYDPGVVEILEAPLAKSIPDYSGALPSGARWIVWLYAPDEDPSSIFLNIGLLHDPDYLYPQSNRAEGAAWDALYADFEDGDDPTAGGLAVGLLGQNTGSLSIPAAMRKLQSVARTALTIDDVERAAKAMRRRLGESAQIAAIAEGVEHIFSRRVASPLLDFNTNAMIERFLTDELDAYDLAEDTVRALRPSKSLASMARNLEAYLAQTDAYAGASPYIINLAPHREFPSSFLALIVAAREGEPMFITARAFATDGPSPADASGEIGIEMAIPSLPADAEDIIRHWREMADTTLTTMDLRRALRRYQRGLPCDLVEAITSPRDQQNKATSTAARDWLNRIRRQTDNPDHMHFLFLPNGRATLAPGSQVYFTATHFSGGRYTIRLWIDWENTARSIDGFTLYPNEQSVERMFDLAKDSMSYRVNMDDDALRKALKDLKRRAAELDEAIRIDDDGNTVLDYGADANKKRAEGDFKTAFRRSSKKTGKKVKGYQRKLKVTEGYDMQVIGAYSRTKDIPMELMQSIKAGAFNGSEQFTRRTALFMAAILRERGIKPDYLLPLPSRAGFPARLANMLLDYLPGARLLPSPPKAAAVSDVWIPKRRAKARDFYSLYTPPKKTSGTIMIVDDWFVTGASIAAVADRLVMASLDGEIGEIDALYGLVLGVSG